VLDRPEVRLTLAELYAELGDPDRVAAQLDRAIEHFRKRVNAEPTDVAARLLWAKALAANDDFAGAERVLAERIDLCERGRAARRQPSGDSSELARLRPAVVDVYLAWVDRILEQNRDDRTPPMELLLKALAQAPEDARVLSRM